MWKYFSAELESVKYAEWSEVPEQTIQNSRAFVIRESEWQLLIDLPNLIIASRPHQTSPSYIWIAQKE